MEFSKQPFLLDNLSLDDRWDLSTGHIDGAPAIVRVNETAISYAGHPEMPIRAGIAVRLHSPDERGFPAADEQAQLEYIENALIEAVDRARIGRLVFVLTTGGAREFVSYVRSVASADELAAYIASIVTTHEFQTYSIDDPQWAGFAKLIPHRSIAETDLLTGKAALIAYRIVGWLFIGLAVIALILVIGALVPMMVEMVAGTDSFEFIAAGVLLVLLPMAIVGIIAYVGIRFLKQSRPPA